MPIARLIPEALPVTDEMSDLLPIFNLQRAYVDYDNYLYPYTEIISSVINEDDEDDEDDVFIQPPVLMRQTNAAYFAPLPCELPIPDFGDDVDDISTIVDSDNKNAA